MQAVSAKMESCAEWTNNKVNESFDTVTTWLQIDALQRSIVLEQDESLSRLENHSVQAIRRYAKQLKNVVKYVGYYFVFLTLLYLVHSIWLLNSMSITTFNMEFTNPVYAFEIYQYCVDIEWMKIIHAFSLMSIGVFIVAISRGPHMFTTRHYNQMLGLTIVVTVLYFLPIVFLCYFTWKDVGMSYYIEMAKQKGTDAGEKSQIEHALIRFGEWILLMLKDSEGGNEGLSWMGLVFTTIIHFQIYVLLLIMQWCTWNVQQQSELIAKIKAETTGSYEGADLELTETASKPSLTLNGSSEYGPLTAAVKNASEAVNVEPQVAPLVEEAQEESKAKNDEEQLIDTTPSVEPANLGL